MTTFQTTLTQQLKAVQSQAPDPALPLEVWAMDESRVGLQTVRRRRLTLRGVKPLGRYQHEFANFYLFGAVAPRTGDGYFEARVALNRTEFQAYLDAFAAEQAATFNVLIVDNAAAHQLDKLKLPSNVALLFQPSYAPELNPTERVWLAVKTGVAWQCFDSLLALHDTLADRIEGLDPDTLRSLVAYPYIVDALNALVA